MAKLKSTHRYVPNTTYAICASVAAIVVIGWSFSSHSDIALPIIGMIAGITVIFLLGTWIFAHLHPDLALLGGAELLKLRQLEHAAKGMPQPPKDPIIDVSPTPPCRFPGMPFRDQVWRINFEDGREPAFVAVYNDEITAWTENAPEDLKAFAGLFTPRMRKLSGAGIAFHFEGVNES